MPAAEWKRRRRQIEKVIVDVFRASRPLQLIFCKSFYTSLDVPMTCYKFSKYHIVVNLTKLNYFCLPANCVWNIYVQAEETISFVRTLLESIGHMTNLVPRASCLTGCAAKKYIKKARKARSPGNEVGTWRLINVEKTSKLLTNSSSWHGVRVSTCYAVETFPE